MRRILLIGFSLILIQAVFAANPRPELGIYTNEYSLSIFPDYPPAVGQEITLRVKTFYPATKVTVYSDREEKIPMFYNHGYFWGKFKIPSDYQTGGHFFTVWVKSVKFNPVPVANNWSKSIVWYRMVGGGRVGSVESGVGVGEEEKEEPLPIVTGEAISITATSPEASPFIIKGTKLLSFSSKSIVGSKEGFVAGNNRDESLRLSIAGKTDGTEVNANLISTSTTGTSQVAQREDKISVLLRRGSTEAYLGDFTADLTETEFAKLNNVLSGVKVRGDYDAWGFNALYSTPKGEAKQFKNYGDGTQGPYSLGSAPVVINSEKVFVDGVAQKRGDDYTIDYQAGTVTFSKKTIDPKSIITINYDYSQVIYQHSTYGIRLTAKPYPNLKVGATYLNDSDNLAGAAEARQNMQSNPIDPQGHYIVGGDGSFVSENLTANGEIAYSNKNRNILATGSEEAGRAAKLDLSTQLGMLGIAAKGKRISAKFLALADPDPKQDLTEYGLSLSLRPGPLLGVQGKQSYEKYLQSGVYYENKSKSAKIDLTPDQLPSLEYIYSQDDQSNDPVTGSNIQRIITRNSAESAYRFGFFAASLKGTLEEWLNRSPSEEATNYKRVNFGLATVGIEKLTFTSNVEIEKRQEPDGSLPYRKTYNLNLAATPSKSYFASTSLEFLDDSAQGEKNTVDLSYRAEPSEILRTDGKYTITTVNEIYTTTEVVSKQNGSFSIDLRPSRLLRLRYLFKPNFTKIPRTDTISFNNEQQQTEINIIPINELMLGVIYKVGHNFNISKIDYTVKDNTADTDSMLYTLKMAPFKIFSTEFNYLLENGASTTLATLEPLAYTAGISTGKKFDAAIKTSISERFSIDSRYTYQRIRQGTGEAAANVADSLSHTGYIKGTWNVSEPLSLSLSGSLAKTTDFLSATPVSYTYAPGCGFIFKQGDTLRIDFDALFSRSYAGLTTEKINYSLRGKYGVSDYVNISLRVEHEISRAPDYRYTDISGNVEINL
ncbi:MAG: hypothetical protein ABIH50_04265 [bacterium]